MRLTAAAVATAAVVLLSPPSGAAEFRDPQTFGYQLQRYDVDAMTGSPHDLLVIDSSRDDGAFWSPEEIASLQDGPCGRRPVLAYMSIGEAEDYRFYWDDLPRDLLAAENPNFRGNFKVEYWDPRWHDVVHGAEDSFLARIVAAGFDGVWLDIVDAFEFWGPESVGGRGLRPTAAADMIELVEAIAAKARGALGRPDFLVYPQNGSNIVTPQAHGDDADPDASAAAARARWFAVIDGIGAEDTFFFGRKRMNNGWRPQESVIALLEQYREAGKNVLAIDYVTTRRRVERFHEACASRGWAAFTSNRALSRIARSPFAPDPPPCPAKRRSALSR